MAKQAGQIRSVLIPVTGRRVLLPNATVAEVITFATPDPIDGAPDWFFGRVVWRGWRVPVFSLAMLGGWAERESEAGAKLAVLKGVSSNKDMPFMAMVTQGFPRLITLDADSMEEISDVVPGDDETETASEPADIDSFEVAMDDVDTLAETKVDQEATQNSEPGFPAIKAVVNVQGERAVIPDLSAIEKYLLQQL